MSAPAPMSRTRHSRWLSGERRGAKFDLDAQIRKSRLLDPVSGVVRQFDRSQPRNFNIQFRHDVPASDWAWGANFRHTAFLPYYRLAEEGLEYNLANAFGVFVEHKDVFGLTVQARLNNILEQNNALVRSVYAGRRTSGPSTRRCVTGFRSSGVP